MSQPEQFNVVAGRALKRLAEYSFPNGSTLRCIPCGIQRSCSTSEIAEWIARGFPKCKRCGKTTDLVTPRDKATK